MTNITELLERSINLLNKYGENDSFIAEIKEALEPTVAELNDEYLRDTHVEGLNKPRIALEKATKAWYDVDLTGQTNLECARNWFIEGYVQALEFPPKAKKYLYVYHENGRPLHIETYRFANHMGYDYIGKIEVQDD